MTAACIRVGLLLQRRAAGLNEAERLVLEGHLGTCAECRAQSALLAGLRQLSERAIEAGPSPRAQVVARAIERASRATGAAQTGPVAARPRLRASLAIALAAFLLFAAFVGERAWLRAPKPMATHAVDRSRLVSGSVTAAKQPLAPGDAIPVDEPLFMDTTSAIVVAHAELHAAEPSSGQWSASRMSFSLERGALDVSVDPRPKRPFAVRTSRFAAEVLGTEFHVSLSGIRVSRGLVRVVSPTGEELARVAAGQVWQLAEPTPASPSSDAASPSSDAPTDAVPVPRSAGEYLALARHALAMHELSAAKQDLASVPAAAPSWQEQAEAQMLLGDWARLSGDDARAAREYLAVSTRFRALPLAENALFSAARAEARAGFAAREQELLTQYLARYPNGQFRREAEARRAASASQGLK